MTIDSMLAELADIDAHSEAWTYDPSAKSWVLEVGQLTISVSRGTNDVNAAWTVHHQQEGALIKDIPSDNSIAGRREALDWSRRWLNQHC